MYLLFSLLLVLPGNAGARAAPGGGVSPGAIYNGNPGNYLTLLGSLAPGDALLLAAGAYTGGLPLSNVNGAPGAPIRIAGPESGPRAVFLARDFDNTINIVDSSYVEIRNLELDGQGYAVDAVKAKSESVSAHHITLENLYIHGHTADQQIVGISTKCPAWNWIIRRNIINTAGTGMYLGDSTGDAPFVNGLIEGNLVVDTIGYNVQIKHQNPRPNLPGMPTSGVTIIRHNVFSKAYNGAMGGNARPNLLVGHWPLSGAGANDVYLIYGNFFYQNPTGEALFQGEGNVALYDNLFINPSGSAAWIQAQNDLPRSINVFNNTVLATGDGLRVTGVNTAYSQRVIGNAVFAATPLNLSPSVVNAGNVTGAYASASTYLTNPFAAPGTLDLYPKPGQLTGSPLDTSAFQSFTDWDRDFNSALHDGTFRGAYAGSGANPGWLPKLERKLSLALRGAVTSGASGLGEVTFSGSGVSCDTSDAGGVYACFVAPGWSGAVTPYAFGYAFTPPSRTYTSVLTDMLMQNYTATFLLTNRLYLPLVMK